METLENPQNNVETHELKARWNIVLSAFIDIASPQKILEVMTLLKEDPTVEKLENYLASHSEDSVFESERLLIEAAIELLKAGQTI